MKNTFKTFAAHVLPLLIISAFLIPAFAHAQSPSASCGPIRNVGTLFEWGTCIISKSIIPLLFAVALVAFIWGVVQYVINPTDPKKRTEGTMYMIWGIVGLFVMISVWGLVGILTNTFSISGSAAPTLPQLPQ